VISGPHRCKRNQAVMNRQQSTSISRKPSPENRRGEVGMCASCTHIPGEGVTILRSAPLTRIARKRAIRPLPPGEVRKLRGRITINVIEVCS
jgi:hypothetical protein